MKGAAWRCLPMACWISTTTRGCGRTERPGGRYHLTARGNESLRIYRDAPDRPHLGQLLGGWPGRFGVRLLGFVLVDNRFQLVIETPGTRSEPRDGLAQRGLGGGGPRLSSGAGRDSVGA
jgi:hypothetical protein